MVTYPDRAVLAFLFTAVSNHNLKSKLVEDGRYILTKSEKGNFFVGIK